VGKTPYPNVLLGLQRAVFLPLDKKVTSLTTTYGIPRAALVSSIPTGEFEQALINRPILRVFC
jgi:hypothetical protein